MNEAELVMVTQKGMRGMECLVGPPTLLLLTQDGSKAQAEALVPSSQRASCDLTPHTHPRPDISERERTQRRQWWGAGEDSQLDQEGVADFLQHRLLIVYMLLLL